MAPSRRLACMARPTARAPIVLALAAILVHSPQHRRLAAQQNVALEGIDKTGTITVPESFTVERVAGPPLVTYPMMADFDERGRLFIAENAGVNHPYDQLIADPPSRIIMLEDEDGDGRFDRRTVFADRLAFPQGVLCHAGAVYTCSPPAVWRLQDTDGDGVADRRHEFVGRFGAIGNAADIHGPFLGPDGRIYWCDGRHGHEIHTAEGTVMRGRAARIFSVRPDGSDVEVFCGGGMDNPVEIDFTAEGEMVGTVNLLLANPRVDCLMHWIYGGVYPRYDQEAMIAEFPSTGDLLQPTTPLGHVAVAGMTRYRSTAFGDDYQGNFFIAQFNMHRVIRSIPQRSGSTFRTREEEFFTSSDPDFHPTDVLEDADGSLLVIDTGGWFLSGCPTSQIAKPEIMGGIYRVRRIHSDSSTGVPPVASDPRGLELDWAAMPPTALVGLLGDERFEVRERAVARLADIGDPAVPSLATLLDSPNATDDDPRASLSPLQTGRRGGAGGAADGASSNAPLLAVWALCRIATPDARAALNDALYLDHPSVRLAAARALGTLRDADASQRLSALVLSDEPPIRREAATALGRIGRPDAVPSLLAALRSEIDRVLEHAIIYALIEIADRGHTLAGLSDANPQVRRGALIALDQMQGGDLQREQVVALLDTDDPALRQAALDVIAKHADWSADIVDLLRDRLAASELPADEAASLRGALLAFAAEEPIQEVMAAALESPETPAAGRLLILEVIARAPLDPPPHSWIAGIARSLDDSDPAVLRQAIATARALTASGSSSGTGVSPVGGTAGLSSSAALDGHLLAIARDLDGTRDRETRVAALAAVADRLETLEPALFNLLLAHLGQDVPPLVRVTAAEALAAAPLSDEQLLRLCELLPEAGALEMPALVSAFDEPDSLRAGVALVETLNASPAARSLAAGQLAAVLENYPEDVRMRAEPLLRELSAGAEEQAARLAQLEPLLDGGDPARGREIFTSTRAACSACHTAEGAGGRIGPDLSAIGSIRTRRDLLEAVVFPSSSFARGYEPFTLATTDGRVVSGLITRESAVALTLRTAERDEIHVPRAAVEEIVPSSVSIMPQGLDAVLAPDELRDLIAYLESLQQPAP